jgi:hypothetical protein
VIGHAPGNTTRHVHTTEVDLRFTPKATLVAAQQPDGAVGREETSIIRLNVMQLSSLGL